MKVWVVKLLANDGAENDRLLGAYTSHHKADQAGHEAILKEREKDYVDFVSFSIRPLEVE